MLGILSPQTVRGERGGESEEATLDMWRVVVSGLLLVLMGAKADVVEMLAHAKARAGRLNLAILIFVVYCCGYEALIVRGKGFGFRLRCCSLAGRASGCHVVLTQL